MREGGQDGGKEETREEKDAVGEDVNRIKEG